MSDEDAQWIWNKCIDLYTSENHILFHDNHTNEGMSDYKKLKISEQNAIYEKNFRQVKETIDESF